MLTLTVPIQIGPTTYNVLIGGVRGSWDLRTRTVEIQLGPARERNGTVFLGTREIDGEQSRVFTPPLFSTFSLQDTTPHNPALNQVFRKLLDLIEAIELVVVQDEALQTQLYQAGEEEMSLACTFVPTVPGNVKLEDRVRPPRTG